MEHFPGQPQLIDGEPSFEKRVNYEVLQSRDIRERYLHLTDKLIHKIEEHQSDALIFLDKSARPVAWMLKEIWPLVNDDLPLPKFYFLNIDREQWRPFIGGKESGKIDVGLLPESQISDLRSIFTKEQIGPNESSYGHKTVLDDKKVLIVDEVRVSGDTLDMAKDMLERAVPEAKIDGVWWMIPEIRSKPGQPATNQELPMWYSDEMNTGRGVGNRDFSKSQESKSGRQRRGGMFLSTRLRNYDQLSKQLRNEMKQLGRDLCNPENNRNLIYMPDYARDEEELEKIFKKVNSAYSSLEEYLAGKDRQK